MNSIVSEEIIKYPRTPHLKGSRLQEGDDDKHQVAFESLAGKYIVIEEKVDGANSGFSFTDGGELRLQSRGHYLTGGSRESQFGLFKSWVSQHENLFLERFENRYIVYGEWMYSKHTVFYDNLPHLFLEFDIWDKKDKVFLSTQKRKELCQDLPIKSVPVLYEGDYTSKKDILKLIGNSLYKTDNWEENLKIASGKSLVDYDIAKKQTLMHRGMEGIYLKIETDQHTIGRLKYVRPDFLQAIIEADSHHNDRVLIKNMLNPNINIFYNNSYEFNP